MSDTNDEAQQADQPPATQPRRTAMQVAEQAQSAAEQALTEAGNVGALFEGLSEKFTELDQRTRDSIEESVNWGDEIAQVRRELTDRETAHAELRDETMRELSLLRDDVDNRIGEALQPFREEMGGYQGTVNRRLDDLRTRMGKLEDSLPLPDFGSRLAQLENLAKGDVNTLRSIVDGDPAGTTMAEDAQHDLVADMVKAQLSQLMARLEAAEQKAAKAEAALAQGMKLANPVAGVDPQYVADLGDRVTTLEGLGHNVRATVEHTLAAPVGGVHQKVLDLMRLVDSIGKDRKTDSGPRYSYRSIDDAMDAIGHAMREVGLVYTTEITAREVHRDEARNKEGNTLLWTTVLLTVRYTFIDPADGSMQHFEMAGEGRASDDKATSKAAAMALKYGLLHALLIPVSGAVPDADAEQPQVSRAAVQPDQRPAQARAQEVQQAPRKPLVERARDAVAALQNLHRHPPADRHGILAAITNQAQHEGLLDIPVDTGDGPAPVRNYVRAAEATLARGAANDPAYAGNRF